jgi:hypothetical protein
MGLTTTRIYGVETRVLNQAVRRNQDRFPADFMFELTRDEIRNISQIVICSGGSTGLKHAKRVAAFTEHGAVMLAAVLNSPRAVEASVAIARAFVRLRKLAFGRRELSARLTWTRSRPRRIFRRPSMWTGRMCWHPCGEHGTFWAVSRSKDPYRPAEGRIQLRRDERKRK